MAVIAPATLTLDEFSRLPQEGERHELSEGELVTMAPPKYVHSQVATDLCVLLAVALHASQSSKVLVEAGYVLSRDP